MSNTHAATILQDDSITFPLTIPSPSTFHFSHLSCNQGLIGVLIAMSMGWHKYVHPARVWSTSIPIDGIRLMTESICVHGMHPGSRWVAASMGGSNLVHPSMDAKQHWSTHASILCPSKPCPGMHMFLQQRMSRTCVTQCSHIRLDIKIWYGATWFHAWWHLPQG
jgi:hypothetical protein